MVALQSDLAAMPPSVADSAPVPDATGGLDRQAFS